MCSGFNNGCGAQELLGSVSQFVMEGSRAVVHMMPHGTGASQSALQHAHSMPTAACECCGPPPAEDVAERPLAVKALGSANWHAPPAEEILPHRRIGRESLGAHLLA